jgi:ribosomal protein S18 acetylase RimI-like enzyme
MKFRYEPHPDDVQTIHEIVDSTGFFNKDEVRMAVELIQDRLMKGHESGYYFIFVEEDNKTIAYSCYGPIAGTQSSFDLYWIATHYDYRGKGLGKKLLAETEKKIGEMKGKNIYVETASKPHYEPTRKFYENCSYILEARLKQFYADDDDKLVYVKRLEY